jgi:hypothetical protein
MRTRIILAHALVSSLLLACSGSHGRSDVDGGGSGIDASVIHDGGFGPDDAGSIHDGGAPTFCDAQRAVAAICPERVCDGLARWYWSGDRCFPIECGACEGEDCASGSSTEGECADAHAECTPQRCRSTGGTWEWWAEECGHFVCGEPPPQDCLVGEPVCDCGPGRSFDPGRGCFDDPSCPEIDPLPRDALCTSTGGAWSAICCDTECGQRCALPCAEMACDCGPMRVFDAGRGCVDAARCHERRAGETCSGVSRCEDGTICCMHCGGPGCSGEPTCQAPRCDGDPHFDECGNCLDCP